LAFEGGKYELKKIIRRFILFLVLLLTEFPLFWGILPVYGLLARALAPQGTTNEFDIIIETALIFGRYLLFHFLLKKFHKLNLLIEPIIVMLIWAWIWRVGTTFFFTSVTYTYLFASIAYALFAGFIYFAKYRHDKQ
jgi:hypothetical protein